MSESTFTVCIDGPAGSGKSTVARKIAKKLSLIHLNSGALFRAVALEVSKQSVDINNEAAVAKLARNIKFSFELGEAEINEKRATHFLVNGVELGDELYSAKTSALASQIAVLPSLREVLLKVQRAIAANHSVVVEGRDSGTVVFPDASLKFFLDASLDVRTDRRFEQLIEAGSDISRDEVRKEIAVRDKRDETRENAPQKAAAEAVVVDTTSKNIDEVVEILSNAISKARAGNEAC